MLNLNTIQDIEIEEDEDLQKEIRLLKRQLEGEKFTKSRINIYDTFTDSARWQYVYAVQCRPHYFQSSGFGYDVEAAIYFVMFVRWISSCRSDA